MARVLVACLGSGSRGARIAGNAVHSLLAGCTLPEGARLRLVRPGPIHLLQEVEGGEETVVAIGEVALGAPPGTVHLLDWQEVPLGGDGGALGGHLLRVTMEAARIRDPARAPRRAFLVGVERHGDDHPGWMSPGEAVALLRAARVALDLVHGLAALEDGELSGVEAAPLAEPAGLTQRASATPPRPHA